MPAVWLLGKHMLHVSHHKLVVPFVAVLLVVDGVLLIKVWSIGKLSLSAVNTHGAFFL